MKKYILIASVLFLAASCSKTQPVVSVAPTPTPTPVVTPTPAPTPKPPYSQTQLPVKYDNTTYDFTFSLPADWKGYQVLYAQWQGNPLKGSQYKSFINGPEVVLRNPRWTEKNPYEDIPVLIFTMPQWNEIQKETLSVSAAPIPPTELGQNKNYVFALPARYDFDYRTQYQEVEKIMQSSPLQGY